MFKFPTTEVLKSVTSKVVKSAVSTAAHAAVFTYVSEKVGKMLKTREEDKDSRK